MELKKIEFEKKNVLKKEIDFFAYVTPSVLMGSLKKWPAIAKFIHTNIYMNEELSYIDGNNPDITS